MVNKYAYDPFGKVANQEENLPQPPQPFKFVGQYGVMTEPNGFYYMRARYYDPDVGRFISEDPIGFDGGDVNLMVYAGNNPVNVVDPYGNLAFFWHFAITYRAARDSGMGVWNSAKLACGSMTPDFRSGANSTDPARTREHGMGGLVNGVPQTQTEAKQGAQEYIRGASFPNAIHAAEDLATPAHGGNTWTGKYTLDHVIGDVFPSATTRKNAYNSAIQVINGTYGLGGSTGGPK